MYNEELENLIEIALADGVITEKEKAVLFKKAKVLGIDQDEFEMVLEGKVILKQKDKRRESGKIGEILRCPSCGSTIGSFTTICDSCGLEFRNIGANASVLDFSRKLNIVVDECKKQSYENMIGRGYGDEEAARRDDIAAKQKYVIKNFPIPQTREDILELLYFVRPRINLGIRSEKNVFDWRDKYKELIFRAKSSFKLDKKMLEELNSYESELKIKNPINFLVSLYGTSSAMTKWFLTMGFILLIIILVLMILS